MDKTIGWTLATFTFVGSYTALAIAYPVAVGMKAGIDFTVEFLDAFDRSYNV